MAIEIETKGLHRQALADLTTPRIVDRSHGKLAPKQKIVILKAYEEAVGPLHALEELHGTLLAEIGKVVVALPVGLSDALSANLDRRIAILRTDIPGKEYLLRAIPEEKPGNGIT